MMVQHVLMQMEPGIPFVNQSQYFLSYELKNMTGNQTHTIEITPSH